MLTIVPATRFKRDLRKCARRNKDIDKLETIVNALQNTKPLDPRHRDHNLTGNWTGFRECHIEPDWLLIYRIDDDKSLLYLVRTGSHSDLFDE